MPKFMRGAYPTSNERKLAAPAHKTTTPHPPQFIRLPKQMFMWGNDIFGDCVTAEEAFALACSQPEVLLYNHKVIKWARAHFALNGAGLWEIMKLRQTEPFYTGDSKYTDGSFMSVDWKNAEVLKNAIYQGPVKIGVSADQLENVPNIGVSNGWIASGLTPGQLDHCTSLCGYGPAGWLAQQLGVKAPVGDAATAQGWAMFTWSTVGIIYTKSLLNICGEAWLRTPTSIVAPIV